MNEYVEYRYSGGPVHHHPRIAERIMALVREHSRSGQVCELGCGSGWICHQLARQGYRTIGVDLSASAIAAAKSLDTVGAAFVRESIDARLAERTGLVGQCDIVISNDVIEHLYSPADLLEAANGLLKPGGALIVATPYHGYLKNLAIAVLGKGDAHYNPLWDGGHIKFFSPATISRLMAKNGFKMNRFSYVGRVSFLWMSMVCVAYPERGEQETGGAG